MRFDIKKLTKIYIGIYAIALTSVVMLLSVYLSTPLAIGEYDDYSLPVASILNDGNFSITDSDVLKYKEIFTEWGVNIYTSGLTGQYARNGGMLTWYFPTYSIACTPLVVIMQLLNLQPEYAFSYTNIIALVASLTVVYLYLNVDAKKKAMLILMLSINTINLYLYWPSAEIFMYSFIVMGLVFWYNKEYKRAAIFISIAGTLNPTIMSVGLVMICEYLFNLYKTKKQNDNIVQFLKSNFIEIVSYGCCYIIGIIPFIYNYYQVGQINIISSNVSDYTKDSTISRFWAYLVDLNFGYLPYYSVLLIVAVILFVMAIIKNQYRYVVWISAFLVNVFLYSIMMHINCGMAGISRYNAWCVAILIFSVCLFYDQIIERKRMKNVILNLLLLGTAITGLITLVYRVTRVSATEMTPIASYVLDKVPAVYNPLHSTFNSRVNHLDGGYTYDTPIVYTADDGYVRKILATEKDKEILLTNYMSMSEYNEWFTDEVNKLTEKETYINIPSKYQIARIPTQVYNIGTPIIFNSAENNAAPYFSQGLSNPEDWGTWTDGNEVLMSLTTTSGAERLHAYIDCDVYNGQQTVVIEVNNEIVFNSVVSGSFDFEFKNTAPNTVMDIKIELPDAVSPKELGQSEDLRTLGLGLKSIIIQE